MRDRFHVRDLVVMAAALTLFAVGCSPQTVAPQQASREPDSFRGIRWDATREEANRISPLDKTCFYGGAFEGSGVFQGTHLCLMTEPVDLGNLHPSADLLFSDDHLVEAAMRYPSADYGAMRELLIAKYGEPSSSSVNHLRNGFGAQFDDDVTTWTFPNVRIDAHRYGDSLAKGVTYLTLTKWHDEMISRNDDAKRKAIGAF